MSKQTRPSSRQEGPAASNNAATTILEWVGITLASGVTGNAAYDMIKAVIGRNYIARRKFATAGTLAIRSDEAIPTAGQTKSLMDYTARAAIVVQCQNHDLPAPPFGDLRVGRWKLVERDGRTYHEANIRSRFKSPFLAQVRVPTDDLEKKGVHVLIHQAITWQKADSDGSLTGPHAG